MLLSGSICSLVTFVLKRHVVRGDHEKTPRYDVRSLCNGFLAGVAASSVGAGIFLPWGAILTGFIESIFYMLFCLILKKLKFDDPLESFSIYTTSALWSLIACTFFIPN